MLNMQKVKQCSDALAAACAASDEKAILAAVHEIWAMRDTEERQQLEDRLKRYDASVAIVAERYPCTWCGGKLKHFRSGTCLFSCTVCKRECQRDETVEKESKVQAVIQERIDKFRKLLIAVLKRHKGFVVDATTVPLQVNGEPLLIGTRVDYRTALACEYGRRYQDESQRSGYVGHWHNSTTQVQELCNQLFW